PLSRHDALPIFQSPLLDFCYPSSWSQDEVIAAIKSGNQYHLAKEFEKNNPTIYTTGSHECGANIYVPDVKVIDNCSGLKSVKAVLHNRSGVFEKKVELVHTNTEIVNIGGGQQCTV